MRAEYYAWKSDAVLLATHMLDIRRNVCVSRYDSAWVGGPDHSQIPGHGRIKSCGEYQDTYPDILRTRSSIKLDGTYLYGGPLKIHFGHLMVDSIIRLYAFNKMIHRGVVFAGMKGEGDLPIWMFDILSLFGVGREHVVIIRDNTIVEELHFAEPGSRSGEGPASWYLDLLKRLPLRHVADTPSDIYLGRIHMLAQGSLMGESYFAGALADSGFTLIQPEKHNIHTQTSFIRNANRVVFLEGSSIYSAELLSRLHCDIFMIPRRGGGVKLFKPHLACRTQFNLLGNPQKTKRFPNMSGKSRPNSPTYTLDPENIYAHMLKFSLVTNPFCKDDFEVAEYTDSEIYHKSVPGLAEYRTKRVREERSRLA